MNICKAVMAGALCTWALIPTSPSAHGDSLSPDDRAYSRKMANAAYNLHADLYMCGWIMRTNLDEATFHHDLPVICWHLHHDVEQTLALHPTPRFAPSKRVYDASLRHYDSGRRLLLRFQGADAPSLAPSILRQMIDEFDAGNQAVKEALALSREEMP